MYLGVVAACVVENRHDCDRQQRQGRIDAEGDPHHADDRQPALCQRLQRGDERARRGRASKLIAYISRPVLT